VRLNWKQSQLADLLSIQNGYAFNSKLFNTSTGKQLIRIRDLKNGKETKVRFSGEFDKKYIVNAGDLLIGMDGEFKCYEWKGEPSLLNQRVCRIERYNSSLEKRFLLYGINSFLKEIEDRTAYSTVKHLSSKKIKSITIPLPPIPEQKRIVEILDETFAAIDKAVANTEKNIKNADELFESYISLIFQNIGASSSRVQPLGSVCKVVGGGTPSKKNKQFYEGNIPWATVRDMNVDNLSVTCHSITEQAVTKSSTNIIPAGNVIIATRVGLGKVCILDMDTAINQDLRGIIPLQDVLLLPSYLFFWFKSIAKVIIAAGSGATVQGVRGAFIKGLQVPLPSKDDQEKIINSLINIRAQVFKAKTNSQKKLLQLTNLKQSILQKAFTGELTSDFKAVDKTLSEAGV